MRRERCGLVLVGTTFYGFLVLMILLSTRVIEYSRYDLPLGIGLGSLLVLLFLLFFIGLVMVVEELAHRQQQPWI